MSTQLPEFLTKPDCVDWFRTNSGHANVVSQMENSLLTESRSANDPGVVLKHQRLGQLVVPGLRLQDAEDAGILWLAMAFSNEVGFVEWLSFFRRMENENRIGNACAYCGGALPKHREGLPEDAPAIEPEEPVFNVLRWAQDLQFTQAAEALREVAHLHPSPDKVRQSVQLLLDWLKPARKACPCGVCGAGVACENPSTCPFNDSAPTEAVLGENRPSNRVKDAKAVVEELSSSPESEPDAEPFPSEPICDDCGREHQPEDHPVEQQMAAGTQPVRVKGHGPDWKSLASGERYGYKGEKGWCVILLGDKIESGKTYRNGAWNARNETTNRDITVRSAQKLRFLAD
jgi:hypothetical protein